MSFYDGTLNHSLNVESAGEQRSFAAYLRICVGDSQANLVVLISITKQ